MRLEAVIVCVNYADFLEHTLPENLNHLDNIVIVTTPEDKATIALCNRLGVTVVDTKEFFIDGAKFNKSRAINLGLSHLRYKEWYVQMDADVLLPHRFRQMIDHAKLDQSCVYGADRVNVLGFEAFQEREAEIYGPQHTYKYLVNPPHSLSIGSRLIHNEYGYCPIGYFQLFHSSSGRKYPIHQGSAEHGDVLFSVQWERSKRILLPELFVYHLESERARMGINWDGRKTAPFKPKAKGK